MSMRSCGKKLALKLCSMHGSVSYAQKDDLRGQVALLQSRYPGAEIVKDIGGGLN